MRLRRRHGDSDMLANDDRLIKNPAENKGKWSEYFGNNNPIHIEIGCGKGHFISETSINNPNINYIAIEKQEPAVAYALRKSRKMGTSENLCFLCIDVSDILEYFESNEVSRIYINFCDPWPRKKWAKRRLTHKNFLALYEKLFKDGGSIHFKTDNSGLFEFTLNEIEAQENWIMKNITLDLHNSDFEGNVMTEYEEKFSSKGMPIYRLEAYYKIKD